MGLTDWFKRATEKNKDVQLKNVKKQSVDMGAMAAGCPSGAAGALSKMMDQNNAPTKILMVQDGDYMQQVTDYALKMAGRLDCEIIALDVTDKPLQFSGDRQTRETSRFMDMARDNAEKFINLAKAREIKVSHIMDIGTPEEVIARVSSEDAGVRYVLSKPEGDPARVEQERTHVPVFDLHCSRL